MMDEELKDKGILIDGKEAKRQFLEELKNKNEEENKRIEDAKNNEVSNVNDDEEEKKQFLEEIRKNSENKKVEDNKTNDLDVENKEIVNNEEVNDKQVNDKEVNNEEINDKEENNESIDSENSTNEDAEENKLEESKIEENTDLIPINDDSSPKEGRNFFNSILKCSLIDTAITAVGSLLCLYLFDLLLRMPGYQVVDFKGIYIIIFLIMSVLYPVIMWHSKQGKTLGQKLSKIQIQEREE